MKTNTATFRPVDRFHQPSPQRRVPRRVRQPVGRESQPERCPLRTQAKLGLTPDKKTGTYACSGSTTSFGGLAVRQAVEKKCTPATSATHASEIPRLDREASLAQAQNRVQKLLALRGKITETLLNPWPGQGDRPHPEEWRVTGVPADVHLAETRGRIFRHYTEEKAVADIIGNSRTLIGGRTPYAIVSPYTFRKTFVDMTGAFLTTPQARPDEVGLAGHGTKYYYVDIEIPEGVPVLEVENERIFLIPLEPNYPDWVKDAYLATKAGLKPPPTDAGMKRVFDKIDEEGGIQPIAQVPIRIVGSGRV